MKRALIAVFATVVGLGLANADAEAARLGGGKSFGMKRSVTQQSPSAPTQGVAPAKPAQPAAAPATSGAGRWLGPLAGLAAGIGLASLLSHFGLGEGFGSILMMMLLAAAAFFVIRLLLRRRQPQAGPLQYAGAGASPAPVQFEAPAAGGGSSAPIPSANIPAGFDVEGFLRQAKLNFVRLQAANDAKNIEDVRAFTTPEMFAEIRLQMQERGAAAQQTDVVTLNSDLLEVTQEGPQYVASVRFFGTIREAEGGTPEAFDEVWHLSKPVDGSRGWVIAGIQQFS